MYLLEAWLKMNGIPSDTMGRLRGREEYNVSAGFVIVSQQAAGYALYCFWTYVSLYIVMRKSEPFVRHGNITFWRLRACVDAVW